MALDSAAKRLSVLNLGSPWRGILPVPDGTLDQGDRQTVMFLASTPLASGAVVVVPAPTPSGGGGGGAMPRRRHGGRPRSTGGQWVKFEDALERRKRLEEEAFQKAAKLRDETVERLLSEARLAEIALEQAHERARKPKKAAPRPQPAPPKLVVHETLAVTPATVTSSTGQVTFGRGEVLEIGSAAVTTSAGTVTFTYRGVLGIKPASVAVVTADVTTFAYRSPLENMRAERDAIRQEAETMRAEIARLRRDAEALEVLILAA